MKVFWQSANGSIKEVSKLEYAHAINIKINLDVAANSSSPWLKRTKLYKAINRRIKTLEGKGFRF